MSRESSALLAQDLLVQDAGVDYRLVDHDPEPAGVHRMTFVAFNQDGSCHAVLGPDGQARLATGEVLPGEEYLLDTVLRVPLETAAFRYQQVQPFAIESEVGGRHIYAWVEGSPYKGQRPHAQVEHISLPAEALAERFRAQKDVKSARVVLDAAASYRTQDDQSYYRRSLRTLTPAHLRGATPQEGFGFSGGPESWRAQRESVVDAMDRDGSFLDVGCANGLLMESVHSWAAERGLDVEPYGVDISPELVALARARLPHWADRIEVGNGIDYLPSYRSRFTFVHALLDCVPHRRREEFIRHCLARLVEPGGRLLASHYSEPPAAQEYLQALGLPVIGRSQRTAWAEKVE